MILAVLFQGLREPGFYYTFFSSPWEGGPEYWSTHLQLYWFRNRDIEARSAETTAGTGLCQEDNEVLWTLISVTLCAGDTGILRLSCEYAPASPNDPMPRFHFRPKEFHLLGKGSQPAGSYKQYWGGCGEKFVRTESQRSCNDQTLLGSLTQARQTTSKPQSLSVGEN